MYVAEMGDDGTWGVAQNGVVLYDCMFSRAVAEALADMENSEKPPADWLEAKDRLESIGLIV
ncbi:MAG: hypothetical protein WCS18_11605 [Sphaerochaetaceae bacterium]